MTTFSQRVVVVCRSVAFLMVLDGDPQAVHGIAAGPLAERDVVWHCVTRRSHPRQARTSSLRGVSGAGPARSLPVIGMITGAGGRKKPPAGESITL